MNKIEHIGIAVSDLSAAGSLYEKLLNTTIYKTEDVPSEYVKTAFLKSGPNKIELLEAADENSPIAKFIAKKGEGIHHIAFEVDDIKAEMARLKNEGFVLLNEEPKRGADNKWVCFVHPKSAGGVLVELCESKDFPSKARVLDLTIDEQINLFQFRHKLIIPDDLKAYFNLSDKEIDDYNIDMFAFYKFDEFKTVKEDVGNFGGVPDYRNIINTLPVHQSCFVFANYFTTLAVFAIQLYNYKSEFNEIYAIMGDQYKVVANSFTEFVNLCNEDFSKVLF